MANEFLEKTAFKNYEISIIRGTGNGWEWQGGGMTRAVVKLSGDISSAMPRISTFIEGCAYNPKANLMGFRFKNMTITVEPRQINIGHIEDETMIKTFIDFFVAIVNGTEKSEW